jgi:hypothetical protein
LRFAVADAVIVIDVLKVDSPMLNSDSNDWWATEHSDDQSQIVPQVGIDVEALVVGVLKLRTHTTTWGNRPNRPDVEGVGTMHPAQSVPGNIDTGKTLMIWVEGGFAEVTVTRDEWVKYQTEFAPSTGHPGDEESPEGLPEDIPEVFTRLMGGAPGMDLTEGGRYIVFLRGWLVPQRDGSVLHVWTGTLATHQSQLLLDPETRSFTSRNGDPLTTSGLLGGFDAALALDAEPEAYRSDEFARLFD